MTSSNNDKMYLISGKMLRIWRESCVNPDNSHTGDTFCKKNCGYRGRGAREGCCDFDDNAMEKIFRSHPYNPDDRLVWMTPEEEEKRIRQDERKKIEQEKAAAINGVAGMVACTALPL